MRFVDSTLKDSLTRDKIRMGASIAAVVVLSLLVVMGIYTLLDSRAREDRARRNAQADVLLEAAESETSVSAASETEASVSETPAETEPSELVPLLAETSEAETEPVEPSEETVTSDETQPTEQETTVATTDPNAVEEFYTAVYASSEINLRTGPGTGYDVVRVIHTGEGIDVTGRTASGWYRTYSGNYVLISLTQEEPIATTAATAAQTTAAQTTSAATTAPRPTTPVNNEGATAGSADTSGMTYYGTCHITFYGPQQLSDGSWSTTTATGTTCSEGRTVAADWDIFPSGTVLYIPNDPLGGDGYYTVEDRGPGVNGNHLDLYANGSHQVTDCEVYIVG